MHKLHVIRAWKWLLSRLAIATAFGYFSTLVIVGSGLSEPATVLKTTTTGMRHVGVPILKQGVAFGLDKGVMIFFCNLTVALLIVAVIFCARLLNPYNQNRSFPRLRRHLQKDCSSETLRKIPPFSTIQSGQLRLSSFLLLGAPVIATVALGLMAGVLLGTVQLLSSSPLIALAYIMPHGIPEIAALLLACSLPVATWMAIKPVVEEQRPVAAYRRMDRVVVSQQFQKSLKMIISLLMIAGLVEAHLTLKVVSIFSGS